MSFKEELKKLGKLYVILFGILLVLGVVFAGIWFGAGFHERAKDGSITRLEMGKSADVS